MKIINHGKKSPFNKKTKKNTKSVDFNKNQPLGHKSIASTTN